MNNIFKYFISILIFICTFTCLSQAAVELNATMPEFKVEDQFSKAVQLTSEIKWIVFTADKKPAGILSDYFNESKFNLEEKKVIYVSDISRMPSMITKMFALPEMKKYPFKVGLDRSGEETKSWPRDKDKVTAISLDKKKVTQVQYLKSKEEIEKFFKEL